MVETANGGCDRFSVRLRPCGYRHLAYRSRARNLLFIGDRIGSCEFPRDHFFDGGASDLLGARGGSPNVQDQDSTEIILPLHSGGALRVHSVHPIFSTVRGRKVFR